MRELPAVRSAARLSFAVRAKFPEVIQRTGDAVSNLAYLLSLLV